MTHTLGAIGLRAPDDAGPAVVAVIHLRHGTSAERALAGDHGGIRREPHPQSVFTPQIAPRPSQHPPEPRQ
jgi:hypothetical protein